MREPVIVAGQTARVWTTALVPIGLTLVFSYTAKDIAKRMSIAKYFREQEFRSSG